MPDDTTAPAPNTDAPSAPKQRKGRRLSSERNSKERRNSSELAPGPAPANRRTSWGSVKKTFRQLLAAEESSDSSAPDEASAIPAVLLPQLDSVELAKKGGGTRKLTVKEKLLLCSLMREPADRSEEDVQLIVRATADIKFFQRLTRKQHEEICREMKHEIVPAATTLFEQDDEGSTFYVVYCGCCKLYATDPKIGSGKRTCVGTMEDGSAFGELALLGNGKRSATAFMTSTTIIFRVEKESYVKTIQKLHAQELDEIIAFLQGIFIFDTWTRDELRRVASCTVRRRYERNATILTQGTQSDGMYFLMRGRARVIKRVAHMAEENLDRIEETQNSFAQRSPRGGRRNGRSKGGGGGGGGGSPAAAAATQTVLEAAEGSIASPATAGKSRRSSQQRMSSESMLSSSFAPAPAEESFTTSPAPPAPSEAWRKGTTILEIGEIGPHQFFGEWGLLHRQNTSASVVAMHMCDVLVLQRHDFSVHIEPRCAMQLMRYAERYYIGTEENENYSSITKSIGLAHKWAAYKKRILTDAMCDAVHALEAVDGEAFSPDILESAGEHIAAGRVRTGGSALGKAMPLLPIHPKPPPDESTTAASSPPGIPKLNLSQSPRGHQSTRPSPRGTESTMNTPRLPRVGLAGLREGGMSKDISHSLGSTPRRSRMQMKLPRYSRRGAGTHAGAAPIEPSPRTTMPTPRDASPTRPSPRRPEAGEAPVSVSPRRFKVVQQPPPPVEMKIDAGPSYSLEMSIIQ